MSKEYHSYSPEWIRLAGWLRSSSFSLFSSEEGITQDALSSSTDRNEDVTTWRVGTCECIMISTGEWTELKFLKACSYHKASGMNESNIHNEYKNINRKCVENKNLRLVFIRKVRKFNSDSEQSKHGD